MCEVLLIIDNNHWQLNIRNQMFSQNRLYAVQNTRELHNKINRLQTLKHYFTHTNTFSQDSSSSQKLIEMQVKNLIIKLNYHHSHL